MVTARCVKAAVHVTSLLQHNTLTPTPLGHWTSGTGCVYRQRDAITGRDEHCVALANGKGSELGLLSYQAASTLSWRPVALLPAGGITPSVSKSTQPQSVSSAEVNKKGETDWKEVHPPLKSNDLRIFFCSYESDTRHLLSLHLGIRETQFILLSWVLLPILLGLAHPLTGQQYTAVQYCV